MGLPTTDEFYREIGSVTVAFSKLEFWIDFVLQELISPENHKKRQDVSLRITTKMTFFSKVQLLKSLCVARFGKEVATMLKPLFSVLDSIRIKRNDFIHGMWGINMGTGKTPPDRLKTILIDFRKAYKGEYGEYDFTKAYEQNVDIRRLKQLVIDIVQAQKLLAGTVIRRLAKPVYPLAQKLAPR